MALGLKVRMPVLDGFLQFLGSAEGNLLARLDVDRFTGGRVAAHAGGALANLENAEADDADTLALLEVLGDLGDQIAEDGFSGLLRQLVLFGESQGGFITLSLTTGRELGRIETGHGFTARAAVADGRGFVLTDGRVLLAFALPGVR